VASDARITDRRETDGIPAGWSVLRSRFSNGMLIDASVAQPGRRGSVVHRPALMTMLD
jgi:hypothetical protein